MSILLASLHLAGLVAAVVSLPEPGRVPKVYNALITSNQNLEPSKAFPVYQPVLQDFGFPYQPAFFYGGDFQNFFSPPAPIARAVPESKEAQPTVANEASASTEIAPEASVQPELNSKPTDERPAEQNRVSTELPPPPPSTPSPIPVNQFGLPPAVLPLGRFDPAYDGFTQVSPFYTYPNFRFYDPFDPYNLNPYTNLHPLYGSVPNSLNAGVPDAPAASVAPALPSLSGPTTSPPSEPSDLNLLNYSSKDTAIPNVPPPPLPHGGLKSDKAESETE